MASLLLTFNETGIYLPYSVVPAFNLLFNLFRTVEPGQHIQCVSRLQAGRSGAPIPAGPKDFSLVQKHPELLWGIPKFLFNWYGRVISEDKQFGEM